MRFGDRGSVTTVEPLYSEPLGPMRLSVLNTGVMEIINLFIKCMVGANFSVLNTEVSL